MLIHILTQSLGTRGNRTRAFLHGERAEAVARDWSTFGDVSLSTMTVDVTCDQHRADATGWSLDQAEDLMLAEGCPNQD